MRTLVWFRGKDLRISDHAALADAVDAGEVIPLFVLDPYFFAPQCARALPHRMQFLLQSLEALAANLEARGSRLLVVTGKSHETVPRLADQLAVDRVAALRWSEPFARERDRRVGAALGTRFTLYEGETLLPPGALRTEARAPYSVFTPFARAFARQAIVGPPLPSPRALPALPELPRGVADALVPIPSCEALGFEPNPRLQVGGEHAARARLKAFVAGIAARYDHERDRMDLSGTSRLSADLHFGTLSVRTVFAALQRRPPDDARKVFTQELLWREFAHSTLWDRPELLTTPFRRAFVGFPYRDDKAAFEAWASGRTGYPVVDAAARQLRAEGFVHNRARMIAASFLTKHLLIDYRRGEAHYMKYLTDGDWANNNAGWQWSAGCGCDAQPYFRVFNPVTQGAKFDPEGAYVRRYVPELAALPTRFIHQPWGAPASALQAAGVRLGRDYPEPIVDHAMARERFLAIAHEHLRAAPEGRLEG